MPGGGGSGYPASVNREDLESWLRHLKASSNILSLFIHFWVQFSAPIKGQNIKTFTFCQCEVFFTK